MRKKNHILGEFNEVLISNFLENQGHKIIKLRFKISGGEVDVISCFENKIIFTEVKYRNNFDDFEDIVDIKKMDRIFETANHFMQNNEYKNFEMQFDIIFIDKNREIIHIQNVFL